MVSRCRDQFNRLAPKARRARSAELSYGAVWEAGTSPKQHKDAADCSDIRRAESWWQSLRTTKSAFRTPVVPDVKRPRSTASRRPLTNPWLGRLIARRYRRVVRATRRKSLHQSVAGTSVMWYSSAAGIGTVQTRNYLVSKSTRHTRTERRKRHELCGTVTGEGAFG